MYVITGATGQTGNVVAKTLSSRGEKVRVIGRTPERLKALAAEGAETFAADLTDAAGVTKAFVDAKAVYVMMPPNLAASPAHGGRARRCAPQLRNVVERGQETRA